MNNATKTIPQILRDNICTVFNLLIAVSLAAVGAWKNILFIAIILINTVVGIIQEIKAKRQIERLTLLAQPTVTILQEGTEHPAGGDPQGRSAGTDCRQCHLHRLHPARRAAGGQRVHSHRGIRGGDQADW